MSCIWCLTQIPHWGMDGLTRYRTYHLPSPDLLLENGRLMGYPLTFHVSRFYSTCVFMFWCLNRISHKRMEGLPRYRHDFYIYDY